MRDTMSHYDAEWQASVTRRIADVDHRTDAQPLTVTEVKKYGTFYIYSLNLNINRRFCLRLFIF